MNVGMLNGTVVMPESLSDQMEIERRENYWRQKEMRKQAKAERSRIRSLGALLPFALRFREKRQSR